MINKSTLLNNTDTDFNFLFDEGYKQPGYKPPIASHRAANSIENSLFQSYIFDWSIAVAILATVLWGLVSFG